MQLLSLQNPVFAAYVVAASLMILKAVAMSWLGMAPEVRRELAAYHASTSVPVEAMADVMTRNPDVRTTILEGLELAKALAGP